MIINSAVFIIFAFSFIKPKTKLGWRALGALSAFIVAMFTKMCGFPLTIYLLSGWLGNSVPGLDPRRTTPDTCGMTCSAGPGTRT